jgi:hypothetical protein
MCHAWDQPKKRKEKEEEEEEKRREKYKKAPQTTEKLHFGHFISQHRQIGWKMQNDVFLRLSY